MSSLLKWPEQLPITIYIAFLISYDLFQNHFIWHDALRHDMMHCEQINVRGEFESRIRNNFNNFSIGFANLTQQTVLKRTLLVECEVSVKWSNFANFTESLGVKNKEPFPEGPA